MIERMIKLKQDSSMLKMNNRPEYVTFVKPIYRSDPSLEDKIDRLEVGLTVFRYSLYSLGSYIAYSNSTKALGSWLFLCSAMEILYYGIKKEKSK